MSNEGAKKPFLAHLGVRKVELQRKRLLAVARLGVNPGEHLESAVFDLPIDDRVDLRMAQGATGENRHLIKALVEDFDDFVFHIDCDPVEQVRVRLPDETFTLEQEKQVTLELRNVGFSTIAAGCWIITGHEGVLEFENEGDFGPLEEAGEAGDTETIQIGMRCIAAGTRTLHVTILRCADEYDWIIATSVGTGGDDSRDGTMTCTE